MTDATIITRKVAGRTIEVEVPVEHQDGGEPGVSIETMRAAELAIAAELARGGPATGAAFRFLRGALGLRAVDVAAMLEVRAETISRWEREETALDRAAWAALGDMVLEEVGQRLATRERLEALHRNVAPRRLVRLTLFSTRLARLQRALPDLQPAPPRSDGRGHFWSIGSAGGAAVEVCDPSFDAGTSEPCYIVDHGRTVIIVDPDAPGLAEAFSRCVSEARQWRAA